MPKKFQKALREKGDAAPERKRVLSILSGCSSNCVANTECESVACEGGAALFRSLLELDLVDQLNLTIAPYLFGGRDAPTLTGVSKDSCRRACIVP